MLISLSQSCSFSEKLFCTIIFLQNIINISYYFRLVLDKCGTALGTDNVWTYTCKGGFANTTDVIPDGWKQ